MLTADQRDEFRTTGLLRLTGAFSQAAAESMCGRLWESLAGQYAIDRDDRSTWTVENPTAFQPVTHSGAFRPVGGEPLRDALDALFGTDQWTPYHGRGEAFRLGQVRASLAAHPWLRGLWESGDDGDRTQRYMNDGTVVDGVSLRVIELTGEPGDVVLMHCDCFHAAAPNRLTEPRMMLTEMISPDRSKR